MRAVNSTGNGRRERDSLPPGFIVCAARSGSTLLRLILNGHPEVACPPETNLGDVFLTIAFSVAAVSDNYQAQPGAFGSHEEVRRRTAAICQDVGDRIMGEYASAAGKRMWVEKSLGALSHIELLAYTYPEALFVCLYRQCADTIASLHEACAWRYDSFGVLPYVKADPAVNLVQSLALYWCDHVARMQSFEDANPGRTLRVRYEDLVADPEETVTRIFAFLGVATDPAALASALAPKTLSAAVVPGDLKARFREGIDSSSVGRGWTVPMEMIQPEVRERVEKFSRALDYPPIPNLKDCATEDATALVSVGSVPRCRDMVGLLDERATQVRRADSEEQHASSLLKLVLADSPQPWLIDLQESRIAVGDGKADWLALTDSETLMSLVSGRSNPGAALKSSMLQLVSSSDRLPDDYLNCVDALMALLREGDA
jgi:protein-tyrosine sulfotransferase